MAGGFVLGEVLILRQIADTDWVLALFLSALGAGRGFKRSFSALFWYFGLLGFLMGMGRCGWEQRQIFSERRALESVIEEEETLWLEGEICQIGKGGNGEKILLKQAKIRKGNGEKQKLFMDKVPVYLQSKGESPVLRIGMRIRVSGELSLMEPAGNPGEFDYQKYAAAEGMCCQMFADKLEVQDNQSVSPYLEGLRQLRLWTEGQIEKVYEGEDRGILKAVLLGEKSELSGEVKELYQKNGIAHLLAISGLHLSVIAMGIYKLLRKQGMTLGQTAVAASLFAAGYGIMTGASGSAVRAILMFTCTCLGAWLGRSYDILSALCLSMLCLLWKNPMLLFQAGFQLSFGAVFGIGLVGDRLISWTGAQKNWQKTICVSLGIQFVTCPVVLFHYFSYPPYGFFLNFIVIPLMTYVMISGIAAVFLSAFSLPLGLFAAGSGHYILEFYSWICRQFSRLPAYEMITGRPSAASLYLYYGILCLLLWITGRKKRAEEEKSPETGACLAAAMTVFLAMFFLLPAPMSRYRLLNRGVKGIKITCLDVGQGDGIVIETGRNTVLIDGGSTDKKKLGRDVLEPFLKSRGINRISLAVVSHGDDDHISGLLYLLEEGGEIEIEKLCLPESGRGEEIYQKLERLQREGGGEIIYMKAGDNVQIGKALAECLYGGENHSKKDSDRNAHSLIMRLNYEGFSMVFTGDADKESEMLLLRHRKNIRADILKAGHHGSDTSSSQEFLEAVSPAAAVISYGEGNRYGHPSPAVVERLEKSGIHIEETAKSGAVTIWFQNGKVRITGFLDAEERRGYNK